MGFFDFLENAITDPIRGIGRIVRGNFKEGINDIAGGAQALAPALAFTGIGAPLAAGIGAAGGLVEEMTDNEKGIDFMEPVKGGLSGFGGAKLIHGLGGASGIMEGVKGGLSGIGKLLTGGGAEAAADVAGKAIPATTKAAALASKAIPAAIPPAGDGLGLGSLGKIALLTQGAGAAANAYGAHKMGEVEDERLQFERERIEEQDARNQALDPVRAELLKMLFQRLQGAGMAPGAQTAPAVG